MTSYKTLNKKKSEKKRKSKILWVKQISLLTPCLQPLGSFSHMAACGSSLENTRKINLIPVLNKTSPQAHIELELEVLGYPRKLVKYIVHLSKRKN
jgi:hypothetical protein